MKRLISLVTSFAMIFTLFAGIGPVNAEDSGNLTIKYIEFGSYPQTEIVEKKQQSGVCGKAWETDGDYEVDSELYTKLKNSSGWEDNVKTISGKKYKRIKKSDATSTGSNDGNYNWSDSTTYHYFRFDPIKWRVLDTDGDNATLMSDIGIDSREYNASNDYVTWENCTLRSWLNKDFYEIAFSEDERELLKSVTVKNEANAYTGTEGGNDTTDKVYLPSLTDVCGESIGSYGIFVSSEENDPERSLKSSTYAKAMGAFSIYDEEDYYGGCYWWLRSPGLYNFEAAVVYYNGFIYRIGDVVNKTDYAICPVINIDYSSLDNLLVKFSGNEINPDYVNLSNISYEYDGNEKEPGVYIDELEEDKDFTVSYNDNVNSGTGKVTITGINGFSGSIVKEFTIEKCDVSKREVKLSSKGFVYDGNPKTPSVTIDGLKEGTDYELTYENNINTGRAYAVIKGIGNCTGEKKVAFTISEMVGNTIESIEFGTYPQTEIVEDEEKSGTYGKAWKEDGAYEVDAQVYAVLKEEEGWENNDKTVSGTKYHRISESDAKSSNRESSDYYDWSKSTDTYRYFRYDKVKWKLLYVNGNDAFVVSEIGLDNQQYNSSNDYVTWETSTLRTWLNDTFLNTAFSKNEQSAIIKTEITNEDNGYNGTDGGENTSDNIFILSEYEISGDESVKYGFSKSYNTFDSNRKLKTSTFTKAMGAYTSSIGNCIWRLRSPGIIGYNAETVYAGGNLNRNGERVNKSYVVRPALHINLEKDDLYKINYSDDITAIIDDDITFSQDSYEYTTKEIKPDVYIEGLYQGIDYTVSYSNNVNPGTATVTVTGKGNFSGTATKNFEIKVPGNCLIKEVNYDLIEFGSYPQTEVVSSKSECGTYERDFGKTTDYIEDEDLYNTLKSASYDENGDTTIGEYKYHRIKKSDATYSSSDIGYYKWNDASTYHYFRYEPIKWRVLSTDGNDAYLISDIGLDDQLYNTTYSSVTWKTSSIREWLNDTFLNSAFSEDEQSAIKKTRIKNEDNTEYGTEGGNSTKDKVFLLCESDIYGSDAIKYGFSKLSTDCDASRQLDSSTYAKAMGTYSSIASDYMGKCYFRLRSPGSDSSDSAVIWYNGMVDVYGSGVSDSYYAVRPAIHLDLSCDDQYVKAGSTGNISTLKVDSINMEASVYPLKGSSVEPEVTVDGLTEGTDYEVSYSDNDKEGIGTVTVTGIGEWKGNISRTFTIGDSVDISSMDLEIAEDNIKYKGGLCCPEVKLGNLVKDEDYTVTYENNDEEGTATVTVTGIAARGYTGTITKEFEISKSDISDFNISLSSEVFSYDGKAKEPEVTIEGLEKGTDYTVTYKNNVELGIATAIIKGTGSIEGQTEKTFTIAQIAGKEIKYIELGSYPQTEIVDDKDKSGVFNKSWETDDAYVEDPELYDKLQEAAFDLNDDAVIDNVKYHRIKKSDAACYSDSNSNYYSWSDDETYHYFRYDPVKWKVIDIDGDDAFVVSDIGLDNVSYNAKNTPAAWEVCSLRTWLNSSFLNTAFSADEKEAVKDTEVENDKGNDTIDKVFLLSEKESYDFDTSDAARIAESSTYAKAMGVCTYGSSGSCSWWLRTCDDEYASNVEYDGSVDVTGDIVNSNTKAVRPAMHIDLSSVDEDKITYEECGYNLDDVIMQEEVSYSGKEQKPDVKLGNLVNGVDFEVSYSNNVMPGEAKVEIKGKGKASGTISSTFNIIIPEKLTRDIEYKVIEFGSYPQTEIICDERLSGLTGFEDADDYYVLDENLYTSLVNAEYDKNNDTIIEGIKYHRMKKASASFTSENTGYYKWFDENTYHYFRYDKIRWRVLSVDGNDAYLLADTALDNREYEALTTWLNEDFLTSAFSADERKALISEDAVSLLSYQDVNGQNALPKDALLLKSSAYAKAMGSYTGSIEKDIYTSDSKTGETAKKNVSIAGFTTWWCDTSYIGSDGEMYTASSLNDKAYSICPVIHLDLSSKTLYKEAESTGVIGKQEITQMELYRSTYAYKGEAVTPKVKIAGLTEGVDYELYYSSNDALGEATVTALGKGKYEGGITRTFEISESVDIKDMEIQLEKDSFPYEGKACTPAVTLADLEEGEDFTAQYENNIGPGVATVKVTGINGYTGTLSKKFVIRAAESIENMEMVLSQDVYVYDGNPKEPVVTINGLKEGTDFEVSYENNTNEGTATVTVKGIGDYTGTLTGTFKIEKSVSADIEEIKESVSDLEKKIKDLEEGTISENADAIADIIKEIESLNNQVESLDDTYATDEDIDELENDISSLEDSLKKYVEDVIEDVKSQLENEISDLENGKVKDNASDIAKLANDISSLQKAVKDINDTYIKVEDIENLRNEFTKAIESAVEKTEKELEEEIKELSSGKVSENTEDIKTLNSKLDELELIISSLDETYAKDSDIKEIEENIAGLKKELSEAVESEISRLEKDIQDGIDKTNEQIDSLKKLDEEFKDTADKLQEQSDSIKSDLDSLDKELSSALDEIVKLKEEIGRLSETTNSQLIKAVEELNINYEKLKKDAEKDAARTANAVKINISVKKQKPEEALVSWNENSLADGYMVYIKKEGDDDFTLYSVIEDNKLVSIKASSLKADTKYSFKVTSYVYSYIAEKKVEGNDSNTASITMGRTSIENMKVTLKTTSYVYNGKAKKPVVLISGLKKGTDYTVTYKYNVKSGKAKAVVEGIGNYKGKRIKYFTIKPSKGKISRTYSGKKKIKVTFKSQKKEGITGYEIWYKKNGSSAKCITTSMTSKKLRGLTSGKTYTVKVRAYKKVNGSKVYGKWSKAKKVKVK